MNKTTNLCKAGPDSLKGKIKNPKDLNGVAEAKALSKPGFRTMSDDMFLMYTMFLAVAAGYDYIVLSGDRTNSGRDEAVRTTEKGNNKGKKYRNMEFPERSEYDQVYKFCPGDVSVPWDGLPKKYKDLPKYSIQEAQIEITENPEPGRAMMNELEELSKPLVEWLYRNGSPMSHIIIDQTFVSFSEMEMGIPFKVKD